MVVSKGKFKDKLTAKALLQKEHKGTWVQDPQCARTKAEDGAWAWRFVCSDAVGGPYLLRLVDLEDSNWRLEKPIFKKEVASESESDLEEAPAEEPAAAPAPAATGKKTVETEGEAEPSAKRVRKRRAK